MSDEEYLIYYRKLRDDELARAEKSGGRMALKARTDLANYERFVSLYERIIDLKAKVAAAA